MLRKYGTNGKIVGYDIVSPGEEISLDYKVDNIKQDKIYLAFSVNGAGISDEDLDITITTDYIPNGFGDSINLLVENVSFSNIWGVFNKSIPYVLVVVVFALGVWFIKHNIIEHSKGRDF